MLSMEIEILYEDDDLLVINKPAGLTVHSDGRTKEETLTDWLIKKYPEIKNVGESIELQSGEKIEKPGIVHRLDKETSGAMVIAKNQETFLFLKKQFKDREVSKIYHAFIYGTPKEEEGVIDRPIGRSRSSFKLWSAQRGARGTLREAVTYYKILAKNKDFSFVEAKPKTGRTHQIRVHFKAINHPVVSDRLYAPKREKVLGFERLALHSFRIKFEKQDGKMVEIEAPYPDDFKNAINSL